MTIEVRGSGEDKGLAARVERRMAMLLGNLSVRPVKGRATFVDDNGAKGGGMRCTLTVRLPYQPALRIERSAMTARLAFDAAAAGLERAVERYRERQRNRTRRPKKYYVAKRLLA